jgi:Holliday junction resolvase RusA-like endonuclease
MSKILFECRIDVDRHVVKKNNRPIYKNKATNSLFLGKSKNLLHAENDMTRRLRERWFRWQAHHGGVSKITTPVHVEMKFFFTKDEYFTKQGNMNKKIPDLSNLYQLVEDCLQKANVIENDYLIESHDGSRRLVGDRMELEITIREFKNG